MTEDTDDNLDELSEEDELENEFDDEVLDPNEDHGLVKNAFSDFDDDDLDDDELDDDFDDEDDIDEDFDEDDDDFDDEDPDDEMN